MQRHVQALVAVAVGFLAASCSDTDARSALTQPSFVGQSFVDVSASSSAPFVQPVGSPLCPSIAPFNVLFGVVIRANGTSAVTVTGIRLRFTDTTGLQTPQVTLPMPPITIAAPVPNTQIGTMTVQAGTATTLPLSLGIGCGTGSQGTIIVIVDTRDDRGRHGSQQLSIAVR